MRRFASILIFFVVTTSIDVFGASYYTTGPGLWTSNIWGTSTTGAGGAFPALQAGDILYIDDDVTLFGSFPVSVKITIVVSAQLTFSSPPPGQLSLPAESEVRLLPGGELIPDASGNANFITIGGEKVYEGKKTGEIQGPGTIDEGGWNPGVLPVKLMNFNAALEGTTVMLSWVTTMEEGFRSFVVQRSSDGLSFDDIGEVNGKGFDLHNIESKYGFIDEAPLTGFNYYRLKAIDLDDSYEYFGVRAVGVNAARKLAVYPNPSSGQFISFRTNFNPQESDRIALIDPLGGEVFSGAAIATDNSITFPNQLRPGIYILRYVSGAFEQTERVIVKN